MPRIADILRRILRSHGQQVGGPQAVSAEDSEENKVNDSFGKKRVFIGSSTEGKQIAQAVIGRLAANGLSALAWFDFFQNERPPLQELEQLTLQVDGAVLIATPDDQVIVRNRQWHQARDNVLFEYGLFAGAMGRAKCGLLIPDLETFRIPSDFLGVACCEYFRMDSPTEAAERIAQSLAATIAKPARPEDALSKGRRLLRLLGWIRDESFRLIRDWDSDGSRNIIAERIVAVSGFIQNDIDSLSLRQEYDDVERVLLAAVDNFPEGIDDRARYAPSRYDLERSVRALVAGHIRPNEEMLDALIYFMDSEGILARWADRCPRCDDHWSNWREDWRRHYWRYERPYYRPWLDGRSACGPMAWAVGVAEAAAMFEEHVRGANPLRPLKYWSDHNLPRLNDAILAFERRLHEVLFGPL